MLQGGGSFANRGDLDYLRGLADRRGTVVVGRLPGLGIPAPARLVRMRWNGVGGVGELSLEVDGKSELARILEDAHARRDDLEEMTLIADDRPKEVELREITIARIADGRKGGAISVDLRFPSWPQEQEPRESSGSK
ncbi:MAG: hypothetical protein ACREMK_10070 [Gemmatimonadota bacterium]